MFQAVCGGEKTLADVPDVDYHEACKLTIHTDCNSWKTSGQCEDNPDFMHLHCPVTCGVCEGKCKDTMNDCPGWAQSGECDANPSHTLANCPLSCGSCATGACKDTNATACAVWAVAGQCEETPAYMAKECPASCGICTNVCEDKETDCASCAENGQCEKNSVHMLTKCPQSCGLCSRLEKFYMVAIDGKEKDEL